MSKTYEMMNEILKNKSKQLNEQKNRVNLEFQSSPIKVTETNQENTTLENNNIFEDISYVQNESNAYISIGEHEFQSQNKKRESFHEKMVRF